MRQSRTANDGTVFEVFSSANGDYIAVEDEQGFHHAPGQYQSLPNWSEKEARAALREAVAQYEYDDER